MEEILNQLEELKDNKTTIDENNLTAKIPENIKKYYIELLKLERMQGIQMRMPFTIDIH